MPRGALPDSLKYAAHACRPSRTGWSSARLAQANRLSTEDADALTPVVEEIDHGLIERDRRLPTGGLLELVDIGPQQQHVARPHPRRVRFFSDLDVGVAEQHVEHLADANARPLADVVDLARRAALSR